VKEHVQIYTDGKADWVKAVKTPERDIKTAHDALAPETQRKQAKAIWAMGQPVNKTAIGRAWVRHQGMQDASLTAKIIPATRRFPEPALALPCMTTTAGVRAWPWFPWLPARKDG
jgi:hypothetical protein